MAREFLSSLPKEVDSLYRTYGQRKEMGISSPSPELPHYFLHRTFLGEGDLLIIFNTKKCRYQCHFCQLPAKSSKEAIPAEAIVAQFAYVMKELKHSLSVLDRVTFSNEGSVLDKETFPTEALLTIASATEKLRRVRRMVLETRLEFVEPEVIRKIKELAPRLTVDILTGFETLDKDIRDDILHKREPLDMFLAGLDKVVETNSVLTGFVLFKPSPFMTDEEAFFEAERSIDFLAEQCRQREIPLTIRLNPMYLAEGSRWAEIALSTPNYKPPRLTDVLRLAEKKRSEGLPIYIGLSTEGLAGSVGDYTAREDFSPALLKQAILFNNLKNG